MRSLLQLLLLLLALTVAGCGSLRSQGFEHSARSTVRKVYLLPIGTPEQAEVRIMNPIGAGFGVVGNLIESRRAVGAGQEMAGTLTAAHYDFRAAMQNSIGLAMGKVGFTVTRVAGERPAPERARFLAKYPPIKKADAFLDVYVTYVGFEAPKSSSAYEPRLEICARLVRARDGRTLFQDRVIYGMVENSDDAILVRADDKLGFRNRAALQLNPTRTARALQAAIDAAAWELARQFM